MRFIILVLLSLAPSAHAISTAPIFFNSQNSEILFSPAQLYQITSLRLEFGLGIKNTQTDRASEHASAVQHNKLTYASASLSSRYPQSSKGVINFFVKGGEAKERMEYFGKDEAGLRIQKSARFFDQRLHAFDSGLALNYSLFPFFALGAGLEAKRSQSLFDSQSIETKDHLLYNLGGLCHFNQFELGYLAQVNGFQSASLSPGSPNDTKFLARRQKTHSDITHVVHGRIAVDSHFAIGGRHQTQKLSEAGDEQDVKSITYHAEMFISSLKIELLKTLGTCSLDIVGIGLTAADCDKVAAGAILALNNGTLISAFVDRVDKTKSSSENLSMAGTEEIRRRQESLYWSVATRF